MENWWKYAIGAVFAFVIWALFVMPSKAEEIEMELEVAQGLTKKKLRLNDLEGTMQQCAILGPIIISEWLNENLPGGAESWVIVEWSCGPPRRDM